MRFEFATVGRIIFGPGLLTEAGPAAKQLGRRALVVTGGTPARAEPLLAVLSANGLGTTVYPTAGEPTIDRVQTGIDRARQEQCDIVIGFGGGSVIDTAKAIAALLTNSGDLLDYLEVIGKGMALSRPSAPVIAIPTTAGAGAEVTRNAVIGSPEHQVKASLRSSFILPRLALVDPELACSLPSGLTASTGLDALTQLIEPFVSNRANPITDTLCREGMRLASRSLRRACECGNDIDARSEMALASLLSGIALANASLGAVHGIAAPLGGMFPVPHGTACAALLPRVMQVNIHAMEEREPENLALQRYAEIAQILTGNPTATAQAGIDCLNALCRVLCVPRLSDFGIDMGAIPQLISKASRASSMKGNPIRLSEEELAGIVQGALQD